MIDTLLNFWKRNAVAGLRLTEGLSAEEFADQPAAAVNHPAWLLSHLNCYFPAIVSVIRGEVFDDPRHAPFGMLSEPVADPSVYATPDELRDRFTLGHDQVAQALEQEGEQALQHEVTLDRWRQAFPTTGDVLTNLMVWHETFHLGQLSTWRRVRGLPAVSFLPLPKNP